MSRESLSDASIEDLLHRARGGDQGALEELFKRCGPTLDLWAEKHRARARSGMVRPSDVAQETALRAFDKFATFSGTSERAWFAWLQTIFHNLTAQSSRDARRKKRDNPGAVPLDSAEALAAKTAQKSPSQAAAFKEDWHLLLTHIYRLPEEQRNAIVLCHLKELPVAEVARQLDKSETTVAGLLQRGLRTLREGMSSGSASGPVASTDNPPSPDGSTVALLLYLHRRDMGVKVDLETFVAEHPSCAEELRSMLRWAEHVHALRPATPDA